MSTRKTLKYTSWIFLNISFVIWLILYLTKVSGKLSGWSWVKVFSPLYISFILGLIFCITSSLKSNTEIEYLIWSVLSCLSLGIFSIMVSIKLDSPFDPNVNLVYVFIPLWVFLGLAMLLRDDNRADNGKAKNYKPRGLKKNLRIFYPSAIVYFGIYTILELISQVYYQLSWSIKFIPFFIFIGTTIFTVLTMVQKPGFEMLIPSLVSVFLILLYLYKMEKIGHVAIPFIPIYLLIPVSFVFGFFV